MQVIHFVVPGTPPSEELHCKKGSLRLTKVQPWHLCFGITWAKEHNIKLEKHQDNLGQIRHMYPHIYLTSEKGLAFNLYLQKFNMDFLLSAVIFAMTNFH